MMYNTYTNPITLVITSILGIYMTLYFSKAISCMKIGNILKYFGRNTLIILATHLIFFKLINFIEVLIMNKELYLIASYPVFITENYWWILYSIVGISFTLLLNVLINKIKQYLYKI